MHWAEFPTGELTAAKARGQDQNFYDLLAIITGLSPVTTKRRINKASGRTLLRNVFKDRWPVDDDIGDLTAAEALQLNLVEAIAFVVEERPRAVKKELRSYEPDSLVRDIYLERWPTNDEYVGEEAAEPEEEEVVDEIEEEVELEEEEELEPQAEIPTELIGEMSVGRAKREGLLGRIAEITGLTEKGVARIMAKAHGRTLVRNVFASHWPESDVAEEPEVEVEEELELEAEEPAEEPEVVEEQEDEGDVEVIEITEDELGDWSIAKAKREQVADLIAEVTGLDEDVVQQMLDQAHGRTLVRNVFEENWPQRLEEPAESSESGTAAAAAARPASSSGKSRRGTATSDLSVDELAALTVAQVKKGKHWKAIAAVTGLTTPSVRRRIAKHGNRTTVLSIFEDRWPGQGTEKEEQEADGDSADPQLSGDNEHLSVDELGAMSVGRAKRQGLEAQLAEIVGLTKATVRRRLAKVHGRTLVRKAFDSRWPAAPDQEQAAAASTDTKPAKPARQPRAKEGWWRSLLAHVAEKQKQRQEATEVIDVLGDRFELLEDLGEADFGHNYVARDRQADGKVVVLKVARPGVAESAEQLRKQLRARIELDNGNICRCIETVDLDDGTVALVMEHCGVSLYDILQDFDAVPANIAVQIVRQAAQGLNYAHQREIFHGALSLHSILIDASGKVKVTDFVLPPGAAAVPGSQAAFYAAPEVLADESGQAIGREADQFSLARVLCAMLDGAPIHTKRYTFRPRPELSDKQNQAIKRALSAKPTQRFATTDDFAQELRR